MIFAGCFWIQMEKRNMKKRKLYTRICACFMALIMCLSLAVPAEAALTQRTGKLKQGKYIYTAYSTYTGAGQTKIYKQKYNGKKVKIATFSGSISNLSFIYKNKLYFTRYSGKTYPQVASIEYINLKNNKKGVLKKGLGITAQKGKYVVATPQDERAQLPLYVINMDTKKCKKITSKGTYEGAIFGKNGRIYYIVRAGMHGFRWDMDELFKIYSCNTKGTGKRLEGETYGCGTLAKMTDKYIVLKDKNVNHKLPYKK